MSISALDDISDEDMKELLAAHRSERQFRQAVKKKYRDQEEDFLSGYMAYARGFRPERGAEYYPSGPLRDGYLQAQADNAECRF